MNLPAVQQLVQWAFFVSLEHGMTVLGQQEPQPPCVVCRAH